MHGSCVISGDLRTIVLYRDRKTCRMCGARAGQRSLYDGKVVRLTVGFILPLELGGDVSVENLRVLCRDCAQGLESAPFIKRPSAASLIRLLQRSSASTWRSVLKSFTKKRRPHNGARRLISRNLHICDECLQEAALPKPDKVFLLSQVRRATIDTQQAVLEWLQKKFRNRPHLARQVSASKSKLAKSVKKRLKANGG